MNTKQPYTHVGPGLPPLYGAQAKALILGSFPSPKSRAQGFYYGHPQNRFWPLMATLTHSPTPAWEDLDAKRAIIIGSGLAVWDVIHACSIRGASDASIKDVEPNDLAALVNRLGVQAIFLQRCHQRQAVPQIRPAPDRVGSCGVALHQPGQCGVYHAAVAGCLGHCAGRICEQTVKSAKKRHFAARKGQNCLHCPRRCTIMKGYSLCSGVCLCRGAPYYKEL